MQDATASIEEDIDWIVYLLNNIVFTETCIISYKKPIASPGSIQDAWGWCTGMIQRDGPGREVGGGFRMGNTSTHVTDSC